MSQRDYFTEFPKIEYPFYNKKLDMFMQKEVSDISLRYTIDSAIKDDSLIYYPYRWEDGDRPDTIAQQYYGHEKYSWVVMMSAKIWDWAYDLPMTQKEFEEYLERKYVGKTIIVQTGQNTFQEHTIDSSDELRLLNHPHHYEDGYGYVLDYWAYSQLQNDPRKRAVSFYEYEFNANEVRRNIKLLDVSLLGRFVNEFENKMRDYKIDFSKAKK